jgi:hypothetical protein
VRKDVLYIYARDVISAANFIICVSFNFDRSVRLDSPFKFLQILFIKQYQSNILRTILLICFKILITSSAGRNVSKANGLLIFFINNYIYYTEYLFMFSIIVRCVFSKKSTSLSDGFGFSG